MINKMNWSADAKLREIHTSKLLNIVLNTQYNGDNRIDRLYNELMSHCVCLERGDKKNCAEQMTAQWLFIWATGRSGSTTVLEMLNSVPCIGISGENGNFMNQLITLDNITHRLHGKKGAWFNDVDFEKLTLAEQNWISSLNSLKSKHISGFKEIRIDSIPFITRRFPHAFHIINYRRNHTAQLQSTFQKQNTDNGLFLKEAEIRKYLHNQKVFELPLEDFTVHAFNKILSWIGITKYAFTAVLHSNSNGHNSDKSPVCTSQCSC